MRTNVFLHNACFLFLLTGFMIHSIEAQKTTGMGTGPWPILSQIREYVYWLKDYDGNMTILVGDDGLLLVDAKSGKNAARTWHVIDSAFHKPVKILINTHYHSDHTGGDSLLVGGNVSLIMHGNCRTTLIARLDSIGRYHAFADDAKTFRENLKVPFGNEMVSLFHFGNAHTAGDVIVVFEKSRVVATGDILFNKIPPYIDVADHSNTENWIKILRRLGTDYNDCIFVPGHGSLANMIDLSKFANFLQYLRDQVAAAIAGGKSKEDAIETIEIQRFSNINDPRPNSSLTVKKTIGMIYEEMKR
jgi:glyoxylase-like metal-dependent hydrolase (beta-lactamase superfamily II)